MPIQKFIRVDHRMGKITDPGDEGLYPLDFDEDLDTFWGHQLPLLFSEPSV
jgi:hypothetical protein